MAYTHAIDETLIALADPTRRAILQRLRVGAMPVGVLAEGLPVSRPAVSQHLRILSNAGLLIVTPQGNRRLYGLAPTGMNGLRAYLDDLWGDALEAFAQAANDLLKDDTHDT
ncbi:MAG: metalloregulator ArsR/SmtB family transcription factor [Yoonia sp.]|jgi:DNA-binding transcriptional ArsR family regulator